MKTRNVLILDDDVQFIHEITNDIKNTLTDIEVHICKSLDSAKYISGSVGIDLFIVAAKVGEECGIDFILYLRESTQYSLAWVILVSTEDSFLWQAYRELHCYQYVVKPCNFEKLIGEIGRVLKYRIVLRSSANVQLHINSREYDCKLDADTIKYVEINQKQLRIVTIGNQYRLHRYPLSKIMKQLPQEDFLQCHRSYIVNKSLVKTILYSMGKPFLLIDDESIPVGNTYLSIIKSMLLKI